ncbi:hypothetical protein MPDQ_002748 [Monascus purpureus]|uniref:Uncharacterized protein n=1 Tax=Monascus purpureus TaxID=5098 RepID=A0A507R2R5_MONPU|nr:hypothetical protein MPDQ_002748 [Monascus purpureus]
MAEGLALIAKNFAAALQAPIGFRRFVSGTALHSINTNAGVCTNSMTAWYAPSAHWIHSSCRHPSRPPSGWQPWIPLLRREKVNRHASHGLRNISRRATRAPAVGLAGTPSSQPSSAFPVFSGPREGLGAANGLGQNP